MRRLPTPALTLLSIVFAAGATVLLYSQAWHIPGIRNLRDAQLVTALWCLAAPIVGLALALARRVDWKSATKAGALCLGLALPILLVGQAFGSVRRSSGEKAMLCNLRQIAAAADQFFLENGTTTVGFDDLVGPTKYVKAINAVRGEDYRSLFPYQQGRSLVLDLGHGRTLKYEISPEAAPASEPRGKVRLESAKPPGAIASALRASRENRDIHAQSGPVRAESLRNAPRGSVCANCHDKRRV